MFSEQSRLPIFPCGFVAFGLDPAINRSGLSWYLGGNKAGRGTIKSISFPTWALQHRIWDVLMAVKPRYVYYYIEGNPASWKNNGVLKTVWHSICLMPKNREVIYVPASEWQGKIFESVDGKNSKTRAMDFAIATPEIHWRESRANNWSSRKEHDASDAACMLFYALVYRYDAGEAKNEEEKVVAVK